MAEEKDLKKMNRMELLEILVEQQKRIEELETENASLKTKLESKRLSLKDAGSIAEASLALTNVFEEAQKAANIYLANIAYLSRKAEKEYGNE